MASVCGNLFWITCTVEMGEGKEKRNLRATKLSIVHQIAGVYLDINSFNGGSTNVMMHNADSLYASFKRLFTQTSFKVSSFNCIMCLNSRSKLPHPMSARSHRKWAWAIILIVSIKCLNINRRIYHSTLYSVVYSTCDIDRWCLKKIYIFWAQSCYVLQVL